MAKCATVDEYLTALSPEVATVAGRLCAVVRLRLHRTYVRCVVNLVPEMEQKRRQFPRVRRSSSPWREHDHGNADKAHECTGEVVAVGPEAVEHDTPPQ